MTLANKLLLLAAVGGIGTLARYGLAVGVQRYATGPFPWHTLVINVLGCFLFGAFVSMADTRVAWQGDVKVIVLVGFMGAFTTFSTFAFETAALMRESLYLLAFLNVAAQNVVGIAFLFLGLVAGKAV